jgi:hypothetical protein
VSDGDNHIAGTKNVLINSFPNINGAVTATPGQLNQTATLDTVYAKLDSPAFIGTTTAPTAAPGTNTNQLATTAFVSSAFAGRALSGNGYQRLPGGLIIQWGTTGSIADDTTLTVTFPTAFTTCFTVVACGSYFAAGTTTSTLNVTTFNAYTFTIGNVGSAASAGRWIAIGV